MQKYTATIQNWRKTASAIHHGKLTHFMPEDATYTYFRYTEDEAVMVILNKNETEKTIKTDRFSEIISDYKSGKEIISGKQISDISEVTVPAKSAIIVELGR
jgi:hypothetical protein